MKMRKVLYCAFLFFILLSIVDSVHIRYALIPPFPFRTGTYIRSYSTDKMQYDIEEVVKVNIEVDTIYFYTKVNLTVLLYNPKWEEKSFNFTVFTTYGTIDDLKVLKLRIPEKTAYISSEWKIKILVLDIQDGKVEDEKFCKIYVGPILLDCFLFRSAANPYKTKTEIFYETDAAAHICTLWRTSDLRKNYSVHFEFIDPLNRSWASEQFNILPAKKVNNVKWQIKIRDTDRIVIGSWNVKVYIEDVLVDEKKFELRHSRENCLSVPFHYQINKYYCGPAALEMVFDYFGENIPQQEIAEAGLTEEELGTFGKCMIRAAHFSYLSISEGKELEGSIQGYSNRKIGYAAFEKNGLSIEDLKKLIDEGFPLIVTTWYDEKKTNPHFRVVVGYNDTHIIVNDPWNKDIWGGWSGGPNVPIEVNTFLELWDVNDNWGLFVAPWDINLEVVEVNSQIFKFIVTVNYSCPWTFNTPIYPATECNVTIELSNGLYLLNETKVKILGNGTLYAGKIETVEWTVYKENWQETFTVTISAKGKVRNKITFPWGYSIEYVDIIGGEKEFTLQLG